MTVETGPQLPDRLSGVDERDRLDADRARPVDVRLHIVEEHRLSWRDVEPRDGDLIDPRLGLAAPDLV